MYFAMPLGEETSPPLFFFAGMVSENWSPQGLSFFFGVIKTPRSLGVTGRVVAAGV